MINTVLVLTKGEILDANIKKIEIMRSFKKVKWALCDKALIIKSWGQLVDQQGTWF